MSVDWSVDDGIYLGFAVTQTQGIPKYNINKPLRFISDRHITTFGPNGSGKSRSLLVTNLLYLKNFSILVIDVKGELAHYTSKYRRQHNNNIIYLNPFNVLDIGSTGHNCVAALQPGTDEFIDDAVGLAEAIIPINRASADQHFDASAQDLLAALIIYSRLIQKDGGSLGHVRELIGRPSLAFAELIATILEAAEKENCPELAIKAGRFLDINPDNREMLSVLSTGVTSTRWLDSKPVKNDLAGKPFDFSTMKERPTTCYLILPARRLASHAAWFRLMLTSIIQQLVADVRKSKVPVLIMLDEAGAIGMVPIIRDLMAVFRGYGIKLWSIYQDVPMAQSIHGDRFESIIANSGALTSFGAQDMTTAKYISERTGQTTAGLMALSAQLEHGAEKPTSSINFSKVPLPTMLPQDVINMDQGYSLCFTHLTKGTVRTYLPDPSQIPGMSKIMGPPL